MKSENEIEEEMIVKYLSGEASPEEAMTIVDWLREPSNKIRFEQFEKTWNAAAAQKTPAFNSQKAWSKMQGSFSTQAIGANSQVSISWWATKAFRIAASLFFVTATAVLIILNFNDSTKFTVVSTQAETSAVTLADQSKITLFRFSSIEYPVRFNEGKREVKFAKGEAFFQVAHDDQKPFIVHTPVVDVKVVGTEFNVRIVDGQTEISVKQGKILVRSLNDSVYLTAGLTGVFRAQAKATIENHPGDNNVWSYATRKLVFKDTPLNSVIKDIERVYPCTISIASAPIGQCKLTATFDNDSIDKIINLIAETLSLGVKRNGEVFVLEGEGCP